MDKKQENRIIRERLYFYLREKNLTINALAQLSNLRQSTINNIVNSDSLPSLSTLRMICEGLEIPLTEFLNIKPYNEVKTKNKKVNEETLEDQISKMSKEIEELKKMVKINEQNVK